ncbi:MAG: hypothetical protein WED87_03535 [Dehalococcoidia bacterium]
MEDSGSEGILRLGCSGLLCVRLRGNCDSEAVTPKEIEVELVMGRPGPFEALMMLAPTATWRTCLNPRTSTASRTVLTRRANP